MGVREALRRFAFGVPTAFPVIGWAGDHPFLSLLRQGLIRPVRSPHDSDLLLLCGAIPAAWSGPLRALFETLALPRLAVWLRPDDGAPAPPDLPLVECDPERPDLASLIERLLDPEAPGNQALLPDEPPAPWRGKGDHGQGGEGMMGGKPYGRPMAMVGSDPDGLMLGALATSIGPFFPGLPQGLQIRVTLQGERISSVDEVINRFPEQPAGDVRGWGPDLVAARGREVPAADLERARIANHLRTMAAILGLAGLEAVARRFLMAQTVEPRSLRRLFRAAERRGLRRVLQGVGRIGPDQASALSLVGPVARASGLANDDRSDDPAYRGGGFEPVTAGAGDAWARWCVLRDESLRSAGLIPELGERTTPRAEGPRGPWRRAEGGLCGPSRANLAALEHVLPGLLWPDALIAIASLGLDMREAAIR